MEYCCTIWDSRIGVEKNGANKVEMLQGRAGRLVLSRYQPSTSVTEMLQELNWPTLAFKIVSNLVEVNPHDNLNKPRRQSRHT